MKIAVFGQTGQLAQALAQQIDPEEVTAVFFGRNECDFLATEQDLTQFVQSMPACDVVVIAAAFTNVDAAQNNPETAFAVNATAPSIIAQICAKKHIPLIYISTDYVFDGNATEPYRPDNLPQPLSVYGSSKHAGEARILESECEAVILRTSWVFDGARRNFLTTMLKLAANRHQINVINDQIGRPTYAGHLAQAVLIAAKSLHEKTQAQTGIYHVTGGGEPVSWAGFARAIFNEVADDIEGPVEMQEISTQEYGSKVARPAYSVLDISDYENRFGYAIPDWREGLTLALNEWRHAERS